MNAPCWAILVVGTLSGCTLIYPTEGFAGDEVAGGAGGTTSTCSAFASWHSESCPTTGWCQLPSTKLEAACVAPVGFGAECRLIVSGRNSGVVDDQERLLIWGGAWGTVNYPGNEVYALDLCSGTPTLSALNSPSPFDPGTLCTEDATPSSRSTRDGLVFSPGVGRMFAFAGEINSCPADSSGVWSFDPESTTWSLHTGAPQLSQLALDIAADADSERGFLLVHAAQALWRYDAQSGTASVLKDDGVNSLDMTGRYDPESKSFVMVGAGKLLIHHLQNLDAIPTPTLLESNVVPSCSPLLDVAGPGLAYDPVRKRLVGWPNSGGAVYLLDPLSPSCEVRDDLGTGPPPSEHELGVPGSSSGTFGRFRHLPAAGSFVVVNDAANDAFVLRL